MQVKPAKPWWGKLLPSPKKMRNRGTKLFGRTPASSTTTATLNSAVTMAASKPTITLGQKLLSGPKNLLAALSRHFKKQTPAVSAIIMTDTMPPKTNSMVQKCLSWPKKLWAATFNKSKNTPPNDTTITSTIIDTLSQDSIQADTPCGDSAGADNNSNGSSSGTIIGTNGMEQEGQGSKEVLLGGGMETSPRASSAGGAIVGGTSPSDAGDAVPDTGRRSSSGGGSSNGSSGGSSERSVLDRALHLCAKRSSKALLVTKEASLGAWEDVVSGFDKLAFGSSKVSKLLRERCKGAAHKVVKTCNKMGATVVTELKVGFAVKAGAATNKKVHVTVGSE
jgi:hypothetical protein